MMDFLIGRQQIFDRNSDIFGYELLFRALDNRCVSVDDGTAITHQLIVDAILELGLEKLTGGTRAFINFTADNLLNRTAELLPKDKIVIEILENAKISPHLVSSVRRLAAAGYLIALDDFVFEPYWEPLVQIAHIIKIDVRTRPENEIYELINQLKPYGVKILLEKIESEQEFQLYHRLGGDYFQGYFLNRPSTQAGRRIGASQQALFQLLAELHQPNIDLHSIAGLIRRDPALSYKLVNFINSAWFALPRRIDSIDQAVILLGVEQIKRWATLIALGRAVQKRPSELIRIALIRARMCELLATATGQADPNQAFLVGIFSNLDTLLAMPLPDIIQPLPLADEVKAGLCQQGCLGEMLRCTLNYENWQLMEIRYALLSLTTISHIYLDSIAWAQQVCNNLNP